MEICNTDFSSGPDSGKSVIQISHLGQIPGNLYYRFPEICNTDFFNLQNPTLGVNRCAPRGGTLLYSKAWINIKLVDIKNDAAKFFYTLIADKHPRPKLFYVLIAENFYVNRRPLISAISWPEVFLCINRPFYVK